MEEQVDELGDLKVIDGDLWLVFFFFFFFFFFFLGGSMIRPCGASFLSRVRRFSPRR